MELEKLQLSTYKCYLRVKKKCWCVGVIYQWLACTHEGINKGFWRNEETAGIKVIHSSAKFDFIGIIIGQILLILPYPNIKIYI